MTKQDPIVHRRISVIVSLGLDTPSVDMSIAAVERDTGLGKDTLRVWERRYGFPIPGRDAHDERSYPMAQVEKLRVIKRLMDHGHRPGRIVGLTLQELQRMSETLMGTPTPIGMGHAARKAEVDHYLALLRSHYTEGLRQQLKQALANQGLKQFVAQVVAPLTAAVGDAWMRGELQVFEEHTYSTCISALLRQAIDHLTETNALATPRVLLTTFPQEAHGLGLLMAESMLALQGARSVSLGTQTPVADIVKAVQAHHSQVVALSFSVSMKPKQVVGGLNELRQLLPASVEIWVGGHSPALKRCAQSGLVVLGGLDHITAQVQRWRSTAA